MKALSIKQPWVNLIMSGKKTIETRTWNTNLRGVILIHASMKPIGEWVSGAIIGAVEIIDCRPMTKADEGKACCDFRPELKAWVFGSACKFEKPIEIKGWLGLWNVPHEIAMIVPIEIFMGEIA